ncbi:MAG: hypothetical protein CVU00_09830 [Bacteroidetes bacterium HGW-Bacteroidetes-17]|jgi:PAS domain S-box-containing protein|nr:MAG: hypothetical protein CVU00_09830 [Bacteroidetes bacterium HGW-Bacteroidetes-17]
MGKSNEELLTEIAQLQAKIAELEKSDREHKNNDNALKEIEERYKGIIESTAICVAVYKPIDNGKNFIIVDFNHVAEKVENISKNEIVGRKVTEVFPGVVEFGIFRVFQNVLKTGNPEHFPVSVYKDERIQGYRKNYVYKLTSGEIVAVYQDLTEGKQVEEALSKSEQKFKMLVTNIEEIIYLVDKNGIFTVSEGKGLEKIGLKPGQVVGQSVFDFYKDFPDILEGIHTALNGETNSMEVQIGPNHFTNWSTPHFNPEGDVIGLIGLAINITDRKKAENELKKHREQLEDLVKERTKDLAAKNKELDNAMKVFVGRELTIRNLQERIRALEGK